MGKKKGNSGGRPFCKSQIHCIRSQFTPFSFIISDSYGSIPSLFWSRKLEYGLCLFDDIERRLIPLAIKISI